MSRPSTESPRRATASSLCSSSNHGTTCWGVAYSFERMLIGGLVRSHGSYLRIWGSEPPAFSIGYDKPMWPGDSGFSVLFEDAPDPDALPDEGKELPEGITLVRLHCPA
jgi:hypothetical protein